jgi:plasmid stabilization system protein ParE
VSEDALVILSPAAESDILEIGGFIGQRNFDRSITFIEELHEFLKVISRTPGIGRKRTELVGSPHAITFRRYAYMIYYEPLDPFGIRVLRVLHSARDHTQFFERH